MENKANQTNQSKQTLSYKTYFKQVFNKKDIFLLPNIFCYFRILIAILYLFVYLYPYDLLTNTKITLENNNYLFNATLSGALLILCGFTDFLDGFIARKFKLTSHLGKIIDPLADKLLQLVIGIGFTIKVSYEHTMYNWNNYYLFYILLAIFILKEGTLFFYNLYFLKYNKELKGASWFGKITTFIFYVLMGLLVFLYSYLINQQLTIVIDVFIIINLSLITISYILYFFTFHKLRKEIKQEKNTINK